MKESFRLPVCPLSFCQVLSDNFPSYSTMTPSEFMNIILSYFYMNVNNQINLLQLFIECDTINQNMKSKGIYL